MRPVFGRDGRRRYTQLCTLLFVTRVSLAAAGGVILIGGAAFAVCHKRKKSKKQKDERTATLRRKTKEAPRRLSGGDELPGIDTRLPAGPAPL